MAKLINLFAKAHSVHHVRYPILDQLMINIEEKFDKLEEREVLLLIKSYEHLGP